MRRDLFAFIALGTLALAAFPVSAAVLLVPGQYATIQEAVDASVDGDVVRIADGTYSGPGNYDIDFQGKAITVRGASVNPGLCVIDCLGLGRGFLLSGGEGADSVIEHLTVANGFADKGGGIYCFEASPTIRNCRFFFNIADSGGGAIALQSSSAFIRNCTIRLNSASLGVGGGIAIVNGAPTIDDCLIEENDAFFAGGGIATADADPIILNTEIVGNTGGDYGGGVYIGLGNGRFGNCRISGNSADAGAGITLLGADGRLVNCRIVSNVALAGGAIATVNEAEARIFNSTIVNNSADLGHVFLNSGSGPGSTILIRSSIVRRGGGPGPLIHNLDGSTYDVGYSNFEGGFAGSGNIDALPRFIDPDGPDNDPDTWEDNDLRLLADSPCIDAGDNDALPADLGDIDGDGDTTEVYPVDAGMRPRFVDDPATVDTGNGVAPIVDIGAFEYQPCAGDLDSDGGTDQADLGVLLAAYGQNGGGDLDGDGDTDQADLGVLLADYGCEP